MKCNRDCFNCPFPDCIEDEMTAADYDEARERDREIIFPKSRKEKELAAKKKAYYQENREEIAAKQKAYYQANREELAAKKKAYREANREELAAKQKAYREANREKRNAYMRDYRKKRRLANGQNQSCNL